MLAQNLTNIYVYMQLYYLPFFLHFLSVSSWTSMLCSNYNFHKNLSQKKVFLKDPIKYLGHISLLLYYFYSLLLRYFYIIGSRI